MKVRILAIGGMLFGAMLGGQALAETGAAPSLRQPSSVERTALTNDDYVYFAPQKPSESPSDQPAVPSAAAVASNAGAQEADGEEEKPPEPKRLIGELGGSGWSVYGWVQAGATANGDNPASHYNGPLAPNDRNEFMMNQLYLVMEKPLKLDEKCWDIGGRVDLLYGMDWICCTSLGLETKPDGSPKWNSSSQYGLAMPQIYAEIGHHDLSLKLGHFYTIIGYEVMTPTGNFFYSHNYAIRYAEPTSHTGGLFTWKTSDELSLFAGGVNGQDRFDGQADTFAVLTGFAFTPDHKKYALNFGIMAGGTEDGILPVEGSRTYTSTIFTYNLNDKWQSVSQFDIGWQSNCNLAGDTATFWGLTQYLFYTINDCWKAGVRYDLFRDDQGTRLGGLRNLVGLSGGNPLPLPSGNAGQVQAISAGLNYSPNANIRIRPELRWDWYDGAGNPMFDDLTKNQQFTAACDLIIQF